MRRATAVIGRQTALMGRRTLSTTSHDVVVCGGGVVGSSVALHLRARRPDLRVTVLERDQTYAAASAPLSAGGIRQQFTTPANVQLSCYGAQFLREGLALLSGQDPREVRDRIQFREAGYLTLASEKGASALRENVAIQHAGGAHWIDLLDPTQLSREFPWLSVDGVGLGAFGRKNEGYFDPWGLLDALRRGAKALGVQYMSGEAASLQVDAGRVTSVLLKDGSYLNCGLVVNACGAHASVLTPSLPIAPRKRCIFAISCPEGDLVRPPGDAPLVVDVSGCYFRGDGSSGRYLCGASPKGADPDCDVDALEDVDHQLFEEVIWPALYERVPAFESLRVESSWAGLYEFCTLDQNAVVGWHPDASNLVVAAGFSGHGLQHAPGVGRAVAELIDSGGYESIDLGCLDYGRVVSNEPLFEANVW